MTTADFNLTEEALWKAWPTDITTKEMAEMFGCSPTTLRAYARKWGLPRRPGFRQSIPNNVWARSQESKDRLSRCTPDKPKDRVKGNEWPFSERFEDDPDAMPLAPGERAVNCRKPLSRWAA